MVPFDGLFKVLAALACGAFGLMVLLGQPRRPAARLLAGFLFLISLNQAMEAVRAFSPDPGVKTLAFRLATVAAALDPVLLHAFAALARGPPSRRAYVESGLILALSAAVALWAAFFLVDGQRTMLDFGFLSFLTFGTVAVYTLVFLRELRRPAAGRDAAWRHLVPALAVATIPRWANAVDEGVWIFNVAYLSLTSEPALPHDEVGFFGTLFAMLGLLAASALLWHAMRGRMAGDAAARRAVALGIALGVALTLLARGSTLLFPRDLDVHDAWEPVGRASAAFRWLAFGAFASVAILRYGGIEMTLSARRRSARVLILVLLLGSLLALVAVVPPLVGAEIALRPFDLVMLGLLAVVASQGLRRLVDGVAHRVYGLPRPYDEQAGREIYGRAAAQAAFEGRILSRDPRLQRLREELGIDAPTAALLERLAEESSAGALAPGQLVQGRYHVHRLLGSGGFGQAFLARDETLGRDVVLKAIPTGGPGAEDAAREARLAGAISHPNVVTVHDVLARPGLSILVMEHAEMGSLDARVAQDGRLSPEDGLRMIVDVLQGLEAVHARGIVHRDVKPGNVLLSPQGAKVGDFGVARLAEGRTVHAEEARLVVGSPAFMAPEQRRGEGATARSDLFSLALVAKACVDVPDEPGWRALLERALQEDPARRWPGASEMLAAARSLASAQRR